jgi:hypothetical protein
MKFNDILQKYNVQCTKKKSLHIYRAMTKKYHSCIQYWEAKLNDHNTILADLREDISIYRNWREYVIVGNIDWERDERDER